MSIRTKAVKLAVAAVAAAGVLGTVWAQSPVTNPTKTSPGDHTMKASYFVENKAEIFVSPNNPKDQDLVYDVTDDALINVTTFGNLGTIAVKTTSRGWDVTMSSVNGGRLKFEDKENGHYTWKTDIFGVQKDSAWVSDGDPEYLTFGSMTTNATANYGTPGVIKAGAGATTAAPDTVLLRLAIGVAKSGTANGAGAAATLYPMLNMTGQGAVVPPVRLTNEDILKTKIGALDATPAAAGAPVGDDPYDEQAFSFAKAIGAQYSSAGTPPGGKFANGIDGKSAAASSRTWGLIESGGFPAPTGNEVPDEEYFYINVGIDPTLYAGGLGGNVEGSYEEEFSFTLVAKF